MIGLKCDTATSIAHTPPREVIDVVLNELDGDDVDAIVQAGTNLSTQDIFPTLEHAARQTCHPDQHRHHLARVAGAGRDGQGLRTRLADGALLIRRSAELDAFHDVRYGGRSDAASTPHWSDGFGPIT